jgi:hypothetical protein
MFGQAGQPADITWISLLEVSGQQFVRLIEAIAAKRVGRAR